jgi:hypothetical protein
MRYLIVYSVAKINTIIHQLGAKCQDMEVFMIGSMSSRSSIVGIVSVYRLDDLRVGVRVPVGSRIFTFPYHPDRLWNPPNLPSNAY